MLGLVRLLALPDRHTPKSDSSSARCKSLSRETTDVSYVYEISHHTAGNCISLLTIIHHHANKNIEHTVSEVHLLQAFLMLATLSL